MQDSVTQLFRYI